MVIDWLPIGSVVLLKGATKPLMICGRAQQERATGKVWDYSACLWPEGRVDDDHNYLFDKDAVQKLLFIGYQAEEEAILSALIDDMVGAFAQEGTPPTPEQGADGVPPGSEEG